MTLHIYQARLLHYLSESDRTERTPSKIANTNQPDHAQVSTIDQSTTLLPVTAGERIYPEYVWSFGGLTWLGSAEHFNK